MAIDLETADEKARTRMKMRQFARSEARHVSLLAATLLAGTCQTTDEAGPLAVRIYKEALAWAAKKGGTGE